MENFDRIYAVQFRPEEADIRVGGVSYFLTSRVSHCLLFREMTDTLGRVAEEILFRIGHKSGKQFYLATVGALFSEDLEDVVAVAKFRSAHLGLYHVRSLTIDANEGTAQLTVDRSYEVWTRHPSSRPRCHLIRGFWAGLVEEASGGKRSITGEEKECQGMGNSFCRFEFFPLQAP